MTVPPKATRGRILGSRARTLATVQANSGGESYRGVIIRLARGEAPVTLLHTPSYYSST